MVTFAKLVSITEAEAVTILREYIASQPPAPAPQFKVGDAVRLDTGWIGVVSHVDDEGVSVYYIAGDGSIGGPAYGYVLEKIDVQ